MSKDCLSFFKDSKQEAKLSYLALSVLYSCSIRFDFHLALLFWNHIAIWRGCSPSSPASCNFFLGSSLVSDSKIDSSNLICSSLNLLLFLAMFFFFLGLWESCWQAKFSNLSSGVSGEYPLPSSWLLMFWWEILFIELSTRNGCYSFYSIPKCSNI